jgi:uncharacterized damage-inducible protein DinB
MTPDQAHALISFLIEDYDRESKTTRRVLAAVPAGQENYAPDSRSMHALKLAWHIASADVMFLSGIASGAFKTGDSGIPDSVKAPSDVVAWYDENISKAVENVRKMTPEACTAVIPFGDTWKLPAPMWMQLCVKHSIHHRGQLSTYLRPMGAKVPSIYGPSGDEK